MVMNNHSFEEQLLKLIADTKAELATKEEQKAKIDKEVDILQKELNGYAITFNSYQRRSGIQGHNGIDWSNLMANAKSHKDEILITLKQLGGIARPNQITDILYTKGFIKSKKRQNAYQIVQTNLAQLMDKKLVEKTTTGEYKLIGAQPVLTTSAPS